LPGVRKSWWSIRAVLIARAKSRGIEFLSTPFDHQSLRFLLSLNLPRIKIGSGDLTNAPLLHAVAMAGAKLILSTGMATLGEVEDALGVLAHGYSRSGEAPSVSAFRAAWREPAARQRLAQHVSLLHCTTEYPCPPEDVNLAAMQAMRSAFKLPVGYSDHTAGIEISLAAVALGADIIEKHLTLDRNATFLQGQAETPNQLTDCSCHMLRAGHGSRNYLAESGQDAKADALGQLREAIQHKSKKRAARDFAGTRFHGYCNGFNESAKNRRRRICGCNVAIVKYSSGRKQN